MFLWIVGSIILFVFGYNKILNVSHNNNKVIIQRNVGIYVTNLLQKSIQV